MLTVMLFWHFKIINLKFFNVFQMANDQVLPLLEKLHDLEKL